MRPIPAPLVALVLAVVAAACGSSAADPDPSPVPDAGAAAIASPMPSAPPAGATPEPATPGVDVEPSATPAASPAPVVLDQPWATASLVDVSTGEAFRIADLAGRPVVIETMAIWCTKCFAQQQHVYEALGKLGADAVEYLLIDVDPSESAEALAAYRDRHGFTGRYVVADRDLARALAAEFGDQVLNPPATPMIVIGSDGRVTLTPYGQPKSPDEIVALAREHGA